MRSPPARTCLAIATPFTHRPVGPSGYWRSPRGGPDNVLSAGGAAVIRHPIASTTLHAVLFPTSTRVGRDGSQAASISAVLGPAHDDHRVRDPFLVMWCMPCHRIVVAWRAPLSPSTQHARCRLGPRGVTWLPTTRVRISPRASSCSRRRFLVRGMSPTRPSRGKACLVRASHREQRLADAGDFDWRCVKRSSRAACRRARRSLVRQCVEALESLEPRLPTITLAAQDAAIADVHVAIDGSVVDHR